MERMVWMQNWEEDDWLDGQDIVLRSEMVLMKEEKQRERFQEMLLFGAFDGPTAIQWEQRQRKHWKNYLERGKKRVVVRLLGEPLSAFLPRLGTACAARRAAHFGVSEAELAQRVQMLAEFNPRLGLRGCRMALAFDGVLTIQLRALFDAASALGRTKIDVLIPFVTSAQETRVMRERIVRAAQPYEGLHVSVGAELSTPRAACVAGEIARYVDFVVFDTMELTQMLYGMDWQDNRQTINRYLDLRLLEHSPFQQLDTTGVGTLLLMGLRDIRGKCPSCEVVVGGQPVANEKSSRYCEESGFDGIILPAVTPDWREVELPEEIAL